MGRFDFDLIVGTWTAKTTDAPYPDHLITFHEDFTWAITNPTNVEQGPDLSGINDSVGMGRWRQRRSHVPGMWQEFEAQFWQLNAHASSHLPAPGLRVALRLFINIQKPNTFQGHAIAVVGDGPDQPTKISGTRNMFDEDLMFRVPGNGDLAG